ncbi:Putative AC transposase [Rhizoctonia solani]|uniref:Putative AC transposase n=1 Tax=Rhizoctonia solani TaxID=456999 RepID=A0A0K6GAZ4_9AGAM|nr:Putative AC transposase [Rhizoctonia solani]
MPGILAKRPLSEYSDECFVSKHRKTLATLCDAYAWDYEPQELIDSSLEGLPSPAYPHYNVRVEKVMGTHAGKPVRSHIVYHYECKYARKSHKSISRARLKTGNGTTALLRAAQKCDAERGALTTSQTEPPKSYSPAYHRAILALWSAHSHRPFDSLADKFHQEEVEHLRPGTKLPSSVTLSRDIRLIHAQYVPKIREYFKSIPGAVHVAIDGWTSPTSESYLGVVVIWYHKPRIYRCILEFIRLTSAHTGAYLAEKISSCLQRYGLENRILSACLDNASNNLTLVQTLEQLVPQFQGERSYVRCLAHIINLMAKAFMSPFSRPNQRARKVLEQAPRPTSAASKRAIQGFLQAQQNSNLGDAPEFDDSKAADIDEAKFEHDTLVVQDVVYRALKHLSSSHYAIPTIQELREAQVIMTTVANLARRVDESPTLKSKFQEHVDSCPELKGSTRHSLSRRVATRWNTDRKTLDDYLYLWQPVKMLTSDPGLNLQHLALGTTQRQLATELDEALEVFELPTRHFSSGSVPLVHQVLPALVELKDALVAMCDSTDISPVTRVGAQAALGVYKKYMENMSICEVYFISLAMCPDVKLNWLYQHYDAASIETIRQMILARFRIRYPQASDSLTPHSQSLESASKPRNRWLQGHSLVSTTGYDVPPTASFDSDSIEAYLASNVESVTTYGGPMQYWSSKLDTNPRLARMALDYLTAPATSVDAERAFSAGRLTINHLQLRLRRSNGRDARTQ